MAVVNDTHKQAVKASLARLVVHCGCDAGLAGWAVAGAALEHGLQLGNLTRTSDLVRYARGVERRGEGVPNRRWGTYPQPVRALADRIVGHARSEIEAGIQ